MGLGGRIVRGHHATSLSVFRQRLGAALASRTLRRAAAIGNIAAMSCIGLSLMPKFVPDHMLLAAAADPAGALTPWLLAPLLVTGATVSSLLLMAGRLVPAPIPELQQAPGTSEEARRDIRLEHFGHELRTPLTAIIGFSDMMQRELHGPLGSDRYQSYAGHIRESGVTLLQAIEVAMAAASPTNADPSLKDTVPQPQATVNAGSPKA